jgi:hypothetical protein
MAYDARAVKISKPVKTLAATYLDKAQRRAFIRSYVKIAESEIRSGNKDKKK